VYSLNKIMDLFTLFKVLSNCYRCYLDYLEKINLNRLLGEKDG